ncbi:unnamed protein product [Ambrosiozyma monospora]|uniref:Unnamed protein product n=1 Tax=Ambrosiozyma monospora TaxID=43982 RepID=A0A9W6YV59_AMBMO|nr:unnamed protein product [Ambrosiozyma monospora]
MTETQMALNGLKPEEQPHFKFKLNLKSTTLKKLKSDLVTALAVKLTTSVQQSNKAQTAQLVKLYAKLGIEDKPRCIFLDLQTDKLENLTSNLRFEIDLSNYINQISIIFPHVLYDVTEQYFELFPGASNKVFILEWVNMMVSKFVQLFKNQLMDLKNTDEVYLSCASLAKSQFEKLGEVGVNVGYLLDI